MGLLEITYILTGVMILPTIIFAIWSQIKVNSTFKEYNKVMSEKNITAAQAAQMLLHGAGCGDNVGKVQGTLTDHYDPKKHMVRLSESVYDSTCIASIGIAAHEVGHAIQHKMEYAPLKVRSFLVGVVNISNRLLLPIVIVGYLIMILTNLFYVGMAIIWAMVIVYGLSFLFSLVTLPVEYDASNRAYKMLVSTGTLNQVEADGAKKVLNAAALTYVASMLISLLYFMRFVLILISSSKD